MPYVLLPSLSERERYNHLPGYGSGCHEPGAATEQCSGHEQLFSLEKLLKNKINSNLNMISLLLLPSCSREQISHPVKEVCVRRVTKGNVQPAAADRLDYSSIVSEHVEGPLSMIGTNA